MEVSDDVKRIRSFTPCDLFTLSYNKVRHLCAGPPSCHVLVWRPEVCCRQGARGMTSTALCGGALQGPHLSPPSHRQTGTAERDDCEFQHKKHREPRSDPHLDRNQLVHWWETALNTPELTNVCVESMPPHWPCYANAYIPGVSHARRDNTSLSRVESVHLVSKSHRSRAAPTT